MVYVVNLFAAEPLYLCLCCSAMNIFPVSAIIKVRSDVLYGWGCWKNRKSLCLLVSPLFWNTFKNVRGSLVWEFCTVCPNSVAAQFQAKIITAEHGDTVNAFIYKRNQLMLDTPCGLSPGEIFRWVRAEWFTNDCERTHWNTMSLLSRQIYEQNVWKMCVVI